MIFRLFVISTEFEDKTEYGFGIKYFSYFTFHFSRIIIISILLFKEIGKSNDRVEEGRFNRF